MLSAGIVRLFPEPHRFATDLWPSKFIPDEFVNPACSIKPSLPNVKKPTAMLLAFSFGGGGGDL
jgi:hypothetical protein